uniref:Sol locus transcriptional repressor n=1 Tax=Lygus hesperus TaxID=30085 RepID=A0A0A9Z4W9_LYGHE
MHRQLWLIFLAASFLYTSYGLSPDKMAEEYDEMKSRGDHRGVHNTVAVPARSIRSVRDSEDKEYLQKILSQLPEQSEPTLTRRKRSLRGGSVVMRKKRAKQQVKRTAINFRDMKSLIPVSQANDPFTPRYEQLGKREVKHPITDPRNEVGAVGESVDKKRSLFLANLLFMQSEQKMPQPLETLFTDSLM